LWISVADLEVIVSERGILIFTRDST